MLVSGLRQARPVLINSMRHISVVGNWQKYTKRAEPTEEGKADDNLEKPVDNQVLVKILATPIKSSRTGKYLNSKTPIIGANECVAEVLKIGRKVSKVSAGQKVVVYKSGFGSWSTHAIFTEEQLLQIPAKVGIAAITINPCTAYRMLKDFAPLGKGDWIIQNGANSAVGQAVHQLCKAWNLKSLGVVQNCGNVEPLKQKLIKLGATMVLTEDEIRKTEIPCDDKPRLALNCVGGRSAAELLRHLGEEGVMVTYDDTSCKPVFANTSSLIFRGLSLRGFWMSRWTKENFYSLQRRQMFDELCALIESGKLVPPTKDLV